MRTIRATARRDFFTRTDLARELSLNPSSITSAVRRGTLVPPLRVVFPAGNSIEAWPRSYVEEFKTYCKPTYHLPSTPPPLAIEVGGPVA